ncbi:MAG: hypothetical protein A2W61_07265 [Deltaproteobacteria bacterium RIFCSPLOWO2_01_44_7]|nr:MAG: hypothetical protein A2W61_07265 [Deltaproteobacteria bacterium RIFCSPLOWO2_01_44_7]
MKIIVTHASPDLDAISSIWLIRRFLPGWEDAQVKYVPAGETISGKIPQKAIEKIGDDEVIHVDTGMGPLDHHQTPDINVSAASITWEFVKKTNEGHGEHLRKEKIEAIDRIMRVVVDVDHFKEVFWPQPNADYYEFHLMGILDGLKLLKPDQDQYCTDYIMEAFDALLHQFENRIWAEKEIKENGKVFDTKFGKGIGFETINDTVIKLSQKMGYPVVVRKDPRKGYVRIKVLPQSKGQDIDLTLVYEQLKKMDPDATWFLHVSKKMLLNGTPKNPKMIPTKLSLSDIIRVLEKI